MAVGNPVPLNLADRVTTMEEEIAALRRENSMLRMTNAELERVVVRDTLTPLFNRRHFLTCLNERIGRVDRYGLTASVMFIDVNDMKGINDSYGHAAGDFVLVHIAQLIARSIRATDVAARIGGDEFALILDSMPVQHTGSKIAALDRLLRATPCRFDGNDLDVSASFGSTSIHADDTEFSVIARADGAMYDHKRSQRAALTDQRSDR